MYYSHKVVSLPPEEEPDFINQELLGLISVERYQNFEKIAVAIEPPKRQFEGAKRLVQRERLRRCQEWVGEVAKKLRSEGILLDGGRESKEKPQE